MAGNSSQYCPLEHRDHGHYWYMVWWMTEINIWSRQPCKTVLQRRYHFLYFQNQPQRLCGFRQAVTLLTFSFLLALNFLSCSTVSGRWILYAYLSLSCTHTGKKDRKPEHTHIRCNDECKSRAESPSRQEERWSCSTRRVWDVWVLT